MGGLVGVMPFDHQGKGRHELPPLATCSLGVRSATGPFLGSGT